jgi:hypothetical protein
VVRGGHCQAESEDEAEWEVAELLVASRPLSLNRLEFAFPFRNHRVLETVKDSLTKAGLPASTMSLVDAPGCRAAQVLQAVII